MVTRKNNEALKLFEKCECDEDDKKLIARIMNSWINLTDPEHMLKIAQSLKGDYTLLEFLWIITNENINAIKNKDNDLIPDSEKLASTYDRMSMPHYP